MSEENSTTVKQPVLKGQCFDSQTSYMPYLTLWDKISQNLTHLEANSHKIF